MDFIAPLEEEEEEKKLFGESTEGHRQTTHAFSQAVESQKTLLPHLLRWGGRSKGRRRNESYLECTWVPFVLPKKQRMKLRIKRKRASFLLFSPVLFVYGTRLRFESDKIHFHSSRERRVSFEGGENTSLRITSGPLPPTSSVLLSRAHPPRKTLLKVGERGKRRRSRNQISTS